MELKLFRYRLHTLVFCSFNRTAYGIETMFCFSPCSDFLLLIAPLMELKRLLFSFY